MIISVSNIERVSKFYTSKKFQFVYADFFPFPENRLYIQKVKIKFL